MKTRILVLSTCLAFFLTSCSNPYYKFYNGERYERNNSCQYLGSVSTADDVYSYLDDNYEIMGESGFSSTANDFNPNKAVDACNAVGGDAVLIIEPEYLGSEDVVRTYYTYSPGETYTINSTSNYSGDIYGRYNRIGSYNGTGNTQTTIRKSGKIDAHPYVTTAHRYAFHAVYMKKNNVSYQKNTFSKRTETLNQVVLRVGTENITVKKINSLIKILSKMNMAPKDNVQDYIVNNLIKHLLLKFELENKSFLVSEYEIMSICSALEKNQKELLDLVGTFDLSLNEIKREIRIDLMGKEYIKEHLNNPNDSLELMTLFNELAEKYGVEYLDNNYFGSQLFVCGSKSHFNSTTKKCEQ